MKYFPAKICSLTIILLRLFSGVPTNFSLAQFYYSLGGGLNCQYYQNLLISYLTLLCRMLKHGLNTAKPLRRHLLITLSQNARNLDPLSPLVSTRSVLETPLLSQNLTSTPFCTTTSTLPAPLTETVDFVIL